MNGANREQLKRHSSISGNLCSAPSWMYWPGTEQSMKGTSFCMWRLWWLFHSLDHHNYVRAIAIHLRDMIMLRDKHPGIFAEFCKGKFTVNKTQRPFSRTALGESHEQNNAWVKGDGGAVGLTENSSALLRWMVSGPEMSQCFRQEGNSITASSPRGPATWLNLFLVYVAFFQPFLIPTVFGTTDDC